MHEHEALWTRAWVTPARPTLASQAQQPKVVFEKGFWDGTALGWLDQHGVTFVVPAQATMAVTADARAQAAAEGITIGRRGHTSRHGQGKATWSERVETEAVGLTGLTTDEPSGTPAHWRHHHRRDFQPNLIHAVVVRQGHGRVDGPGGNTVFLTNALVRQPLPPFDDDDDRRLIAHGWIKAAKQQWERGHPPQKTERAVPVPVMFTLRMCALATA